MAEKTNPFRNVQVKFRRSRPLTKIIVIVTIVLCTIAMITLHLGYGVAMLFHELIHPWLIIGIFPITIHFIFAGWIWMDRPVRWGLPEEEYTITRFWRAANIASLIAMVVLYVAALTITQ